MADERAEREEQEAAAQREFALAEAQAAAEQEQLEREQDGMATGEGPELERDLDEEVPDADDDGAASDWVDDEQVIDEDGIIPGMDDEGEGDYADEGGRDLDDDVPEAGSYQHTDTEAEDESSDEDESPMTAFREVGNTPGGGVLGSSVFGSSPAVRVQRGPSGARRSAGGRRREN